jgi:hypothetical protein
MTLLRAPGIFLVALVLSVAAPAAAESPGQGAPDKLQALIEELKRELDRGEKERLIDPWYLRDLRAVLGRYEWPWARNLFSDDFTGRGPQPGPPWKVTAGEWLIDWRFGLRSVIRAQPQAAPQPERDKSSDKDVVKQLFGQILKQNLEGDRAGQPEQAPASTAPGYAAAIAPVAITNAFALRLEITSRAVERPPDGRFEFGPYQGDNAAAGYRLVYTPQARAGAPTLELLSLSSRGTVSTVEVYTKPINLEDGQVHVFEWTRDGAGRMAVRLDGTEVMNVTDRRFRDPFQGLALVNSGGDYAVRSLKVDGTG